MIVKIGRWLAENWQIFGLFFLMLSSLALTGSITKGIRAAKEGFKELWNPLGFIVFISIIVTVFVLYKKLTSL